MKKKLAELQLCFHLIFALLLFVVSVLIMFLLWKRFGIIFEVLVIPVFCLCVCFLCVSVAVDIVIYEVCGYRQRRKNKKSKKQEVNP